MPFAILVLSTLLVDIAINLSVGSLPLALHADGASRTAISLVVGSGLIVSLFGSVPVGALVDRVGRLPTIRVAGALSVLAMIGLAVTHGAGTTALTVALRSIALVAYTTAEFAYASALFAPDRAASAVGTIGMIGNLAFATSPALGVFLWQHGIERSQFGYGAVLASVGVAILFALPAKHDVKTSGRSRTIAMRSAWIPAIVFLVSVTLQSGVNAALAVLAFRDRGIANGALLFTAMAITTFVLRYPAGRLVDRFGPRIVAIPIAVLQCAGSLIAAQATTNTSVIVAGAFMGFAWSAAVPVGLALFFERSSPRTRGAAMGAYNLAFSLGATLGAVIAAIASAVHGGYTAAITVCAFSALLGLPVVLTSRPRVRRPAARVVAPGAQVPQAS
jgi:MFS family permease